MEGIIEVEKENGNKFFTRGDKEGKYISVLECGYIILKDGTFIILSNNHGESLTDFYVTYHNIEKFTKLTTQDAVKALANDGFVIFLGTCRNNINSVTDLGFAILYLLDNLTEEQIIACKKLLETNKRILNKNENKIRIEYGNGLDLSLLTEYEVRNILNPKVLKK